MNSFVDFELINSLSDEQLATEYKKSHTAINVIILRYTHYIKRIVVNYHPVSSDIDDYVQEGTIALLDAFKTYHQNRGVKFSTYANVCISNRIKTTYNRKNYLKFILYEDIESINNEQSEVSPESIFEQQENILELVENIKKILSTKEWDIFQYYIRGCRYEQIARHLNISHKVVDNAMQRIRRKLKSVCINDS